MAPGAAPLCRLGPLTLRVWSWLPVTRRPAAARSAVMGFWCAQGTVWVRRQATTSLPLCRADRELPRPEVPGTTSHMRQPVNVTGRAVPLSLPTPLTSELQRAEDRMCLQGEEIQGTIEPSGHHPATEMQVAPFSRWWGQLRSSGQLRRSLAKARKQRTPAAPVNSANPAMPGSDVQWR